MKKKPNLLLIGIDSLLSKHMSCYGYFRHTTPYMDKFAEGGTLFENYFSPHVPTTPGYASMFTGLDCFGDNTVALRHKGLVLGKTLAEILNENGYETTCIGFRGNAAARGFKNYLDFANWSAGDDGRAHKAENLNAAALPELRRLAAQDKPWFLFLRHMDPHTPYLPPKPFDRLFYEGNEYDPKNKSMDPVFNFKPFCDYFKDWMPTGPKGELLTDKDYVIAQYDGAVCYMDTCIKNIFTTLSTLGLDDNTVVVITSDHGETLYDHDCYFDHHSINDNTLCVPLIIKYPGVVPAGLRIKGWGRHQDLVPTLKEIMGFQTKEKFDGESLMPLVRGEKASTCSEFYISECTWMRKHGWRTPQWKLIRALEPDFHFKPEVELFDLINDPEENINVAEQNPDIVKTLTARMNAFIAKREKQTGRPNPMFHQEYWHGCMNVGPYFKSSQEAYDTMHIGSARQAASLQSKTDAAKKDAEDKKTAAKKPAAKVPVKPATKAPAKPAAKAPAKKATSKGKK
ncbi:MAG: sulfatase [Victivallales bacterium]|nr:sulfatase [Victivallales bacterium]